ncbi:MAG: ABC transporter substrate-binding protein [Actinomycetota bacterium]
MLRVVASLTGPSFRYDGPFVDGMRLAEREINTQGGIARRAIRIEVADDRGDLERTIELLRESVATQPAAALVVGPASAVAVAREDIERSQLAVVLLGGDLFTARALFRQVFQTSTPIRWQAPVLASSLRGAGRVLVVTEESPERRALSLALSQALGSFGVNSVEEESLPTGGDLGPVLARARSAGAVVFLGSGREAARLAEGLRTLPNQPRLAVSAEGLSPELSGLPPAPGTIAAYPHSWAGWANPIPWVSTFRARFQATFGRLPVGFEQEGYDAIRLLADALRRTRGEGGDHLVRALEAVRAPNREPFYSALPIRLGPDDHTLISENAVGLFTIPSTPQAGPLLTATPWVPVSG